MPAPVPVFLLYLHSTAFDPTPLSPSLHPFLHPYVLSCVLPCEHACKVFACEHVCTQMRCTFRSLLGSDCLLLALTLQIPSPLNLFHTSHHTFCQHVSTLDTNASRSALNQDLSTSSSALRALLSFSISKQ